MGNTPPTLDYAAAKPRSRLRKWTRRILFAVLVLACLYATPIAWLYWGWKQEQPAREMVGRVDGLFRKKPCGSAFIGKLLPAGLEWIRDRVLQVSWQPVDEDELNVLPRLRRLEILTLSGSSVTDSSLAHVQTLKQLQMLSLSYARVTDGGLVYLKGLSGLQVLNLIDTRVTAAGVADLQKALPRCKIIHSPPAPTP